LSSQTFAAFEEIPGVYSSCFEVMLTSLARKNKVTVCGFASAFLWSATKRFLWLFS